LAERVEFWVRSMLPEIEQVRQAAYHRWVRRGRPHACDREDWFAAEDALTFALNYQTIAAYSLDDVPVKILGDQQRRYCRFCERTDGQVAFGPPMELLAGGCSPTLCTAAVCNECRTAFRDVQAARLERFRAVLAEWATRSAAGDGARAPEGYSPDVFKSLVACALSIMPESEIGFCADALEWVSNPDAESDGALLERDANCLVYQAPFWGERSWTAIARRIDNDVPLPYLIYFLAVRGVILQISLPLCIRDHDLDGREVRVPRRSFAVGEGESFEEARVKEFSVTRGGSGLVRETGAAHRSLADASG
jgi:hypothetical protein